MKYNSYTLKELLNKHNNLHIVGFNYGHSVEAKQKLKEDLKLMRLTRLMKEDANTAWYFQKEKLDWKNTNQLKYKLYYDLEHNTINCNVSITKAGILDAYFPTDSSIIESLEKHQDLIHQVFGNNDAKPSSEKSPPKTLKELNDWFEYFRAIINKSTDSNESKPTKEQE